MLLKKSAFNQYYCIIFQIDHIFISPLALSHGSRDLTLSLSVRQYSEIVFQVPTRVLLSSISKVSNNFVCIYILAYQQCYFIAVSCRHASNNIEQMVAVPTAVVQGRCSQYSRSPAVRPLTTVMSFISTPIMQCLTALHHALQPGQCDIS